MGATLAAIASHKINLDGYTQSKAEELLKEVMKQFPQPWKDAVEPDEGKRLYDYDICYFQDHGIVLVNFMLPLYFSFTLYPKVIDIDGGYSYSTLYNGFFDKDHWYRKQLFDWIKFFEIEEVIYLPTNGYPMVKYLDEDIFENKSYEEIRHHIQKDYGPPMTRDNYDARKINENYQTIWVVDDFADLRLANKN